MKIYKLFVLAKFSLVNFRVNWLSFFNYIDILLLIPYRGDLLSFYAILTFYFSVNSYSFNIYVKKLENAINKKTSKAIVFSICLDAKVLTSEYQLFISYTYSEIVDQVKNLILSQKTFSLFSKASVRRCFSK